ncbi:unnamed protein product [Linum tenue]|uniref:Uncharacterized protein n=1 Tax=Linum tenue TaxID=586396 RepID=A0AAV0KAX8_9ROSI|nr:unnamed protein product [Linum tenue]CAI0419499.1 unnamed protein product [Linum tenue]CAI0419500.1 unnamed protein product [Linum tenue]CAI0419501.1 unnamed protein product [Linum tenue]CAI0419502.1 unnamed protein product [Linum tenue]
MASSDDLELPQLTYYKHPQCKSCQELDKKEMKEEYDDEDYVSRYDDFGGDKTLRLHVIFYRRRLFEEGGFYFGCRPNYFNLETLPYPREHFNFQPGFDSIVEECADFAVYAYNEERDADMELCGIEEASVGGSVGIKTFYLIIRCRNGDSDGDGGSSTDDGKRKRSSDESDSEKTYRVVLSCRWWSRDLKEILLFRDSKGENLMKPDPIFDARIKPGKRRPPPS